MGRAGEYPVRRDDRGAAARGQTIAWRLAAELRGWSRRSGACARRSSRRCAPRSRASRRRWPDHAELTAPPTASRTRAASRCASCPARHTDRERRYYELHIADTGAVRDGGPEELARPLQRARVDRLSRAKAAINAQHVALLEERGEAEAKRRSPGAATR
jgi:hypothetical protein